MLIQLWILKLHIFLSFVLTGVIWIVQLVHYPSFHYIESTNFREFEKFHIFRTSILLGPLMILELLTGAILLTGSSFLPGYILWINFIFMTLIWLITLLWSLPLHKKLNKGKDRDLINNLILSNWPRAFLWTGKSFLLFIYFPN